MFSTPPYLHVVTHAAWAGIDRRIAHGAAHYCRDRDLPALLPGLMWAGNDAPPGRTEIIRQLNRALARERRLGATGHWAYNLVRHMALARALKAEELALSPAQSRSGAPRGK